MKKLIALLSVLTLIGNYGYCAQPFGYDLAKDVYRTKNAEKTSKAAAKPSKKPANTPANTPAKPLNDTESVKSKFFADDIEAEWEKSKVFYENATMNSAIRKYKLKNYSGALQEFISIVKKDKSNPLAYYYLGMSYTQVGNQEQALKAYEQVLKLKADPTLESYALKGRCNVNSSACEGLQTPEQKTNTQEVSSEDKALDEFIKAPYGNGFSKELNQQIREQEFKNIYRTIEQKDELNERDIQRIKDFDKGSYNNSGSEIVAEVSNEDIIAAIDVLKRAGITVSVNPYQQQLPAEFDEFNQLSMLLSNGNNNSNNNMMNNMIPYLLQQNQNGQKIDPQILQTMMMNSMLPNFSFDNDKKY